MCVCVHSAYPEELNTRSLKEGGLFLAPKHIAWWLVGMVAQNKYLWMNEYVPPSNSELIFFFSQNWVIISESIYEIYNIQQVFIICYIQHFVKCDWHWSQKVPTSWNVDQKNGIKPGVRFKMEYRWNKLIIVEAVEVPCICLKFSIIIYF